MMTGVGEVEVPGQEAIEQRPYVAFVEVLHVPVSGRCLPRYAGQLDTERTARPR